MRLVIFPIFFLAGWVTGVALADKAKHDNFPGQLSFWEAE